MISDGRSTILRAALRAGLMTAPARREAIVQLYQVERVIEGTPDGREFWYEVEVACEPP